MCIATSLALCVLAAIAANSAEAASVHLKVSDGIDGVDAGIAFASEDSPVEAIVVAAASTNTIETESDELDASDSDSESDDAAQQPTTAISASTHLRQAKHHAKGSYDQTCSVMAKGPWSSIQYVCSWRKSGNYNVFFKRKDGSFVYECQCRSDIDDTYGAFGAHWHHSTDDDVECFARDGADAADLRAVFKSVQCKGSLAKTCDTKSGTDTCTFFEPKADPNSSE